MGKSDDKIQFISLVVGLIVLFFLGYIIKILLPPEYQIYLYIFAGLVVVGIGFMIYFCIKILNLEKKPFLFFES